MQVKIIIRVYASNNGDLEGPCWTIAVGTSTIAREVCGIIEAHVAVLPSSLCLCLINALTNTDGMPSRSRFIIIITFVDGERKVMDEERLLQVRGEWLNKGCVPFFFVREKTSSLLMHGCYSCPAY